MAFKILFVCTGNTCRSSMAEAIARTLWEKADLHGTGVPGLNQPAALEFSSAGLFAQSGAEASPNAIKVLGEAGLDLTAHRSRPLTKELAEEADLILTMTPGHLTYIRTKFPEAADKTWVLTEYASRAFGEAGAADETASFHPGIDDPYGGPVELYREVALQLEAAISQILARLRDTNFPV